MRSSACEHTLKQISVVVNKPKSEDWPLQDPAVVIKTARQIVELAPELTPFQADFLKELVRLASRFKETFRMTPKQIEVLDSLYVRYVWPTEVDAKTNKITPPNPDEPT